VIQPHSSLQREKVIERLKAGERVVHCRFQNEAGVASSTTSFVDERDAVTVHPATFAHLLSLRWIRPVRGTTDVYEYCGP